MSRFVAAGVVAGAVIAAELLRRRMAGERGKRGGRLGGGGGGSSSQRGREGAEEFGDIAWVSTRARQLVGGSGPAYIMEHIARLSDTYDEVTNPVRVCSPPVERKSQLEAWDS